MKKTHLSLFGALLISLSAAASSNIIIGENEIEKLKDLDPKSEIYLRSLPTGRLKLPGPLGIPDYCTVALIGPNEILTAAHCLTKRDVSKMVAYFEYYTKEQKTQNPYAVKSVKLNLPDEDIAILELEGYPGHKYGFYPLAKTLPEIKEPLIIFEHPGLDEKSVSRKNCFFEDTDQLELLHTCDTEGYSSGSPILNSRFEIIGVHQGSMITENSEYNYGRLVIHLKDSPN